MSVRVCEYVMCREFMCKCTYVCICVHVCVRPGMGV